jgi:hypothetical protein
MKKNKIKSVQVGHSKTVHLKTRPLIPQNYEMTTTQKIDDCLVLGRERDSTILMSNNDS